MKCIAIWVLTLLLTSSCSNSSNNANSNTNEGDMGSEQDDMSRADAGADTGTQADVTYSDWCDFENPCENPAEVCQFIIEDELASGAFECRPALGNKGEGEGCSRPNDLPGEDDCGPGLFCHAFGQGPATCKPMCDTPESDSCDDFGEIGCVPVARFASIGVCVPECDLATNDCPDGEKCGRWGYFEVCDLDGGAAVGGSCTDSNDCSVQQVCTGPVGASTCELTCDDDIACSDTQGCSLGEDFLRFPHCVDLDWSCVGSVTYPTPAAADSAVTVVLGPDFIDFDSGTIKACAADDEMCAAPLDEMSIDANRSATLTVPLGANGFDGYFEATASYGDPVLYYPAAPVTDASVTLEIWMRIRSSEWLNGAGLDPTRGELRATVHDCSGELTSGVSVADVGPVDSGYDSLEYGQLLNRDRPATGPRALVGIVNLATGPHTFTFINASGTTIAQRNVLIRANSTTVVEVTPTP